MPFDRFWGALCRWLTANDLILHIPAKGAMWLERKRPAQNCVYPSIQP
jgi:hypothetical protein